MMSGPNRFTMLLIVSSSFFFTAPRLGLIRADRGNGYRNSTARVSKRLTTHAIACLRAQYRKG